MTQYPVDLIWGPGPYERLVATLHEFDDEAPTDYVAFLDRVFYIRAVEGAPRPEFPRSAADMLDFRGEDATAIWYVMRADFPLDAWALVRDAADTLALRPEATGLVKRLVGDETAQLHAQRSLGSPGEN